MFLNIKKMKSLKYLSVLLIILLFMGCKKENKTSVENPFFSEFTGKYGSIPFSKIKNEHYMPAFKRGIELAKMEVQKIIHSTEDPTFENTIEELERSGEELSKVQGVFYNLFHSNSDTTMDRISEQISPLLTELNDEIYLNDSLFAKVDAIYQQKQFIKLKTEQSMLLEDTYRNFINHGAQLDSAKKLRLKEINKQLSLADLKFGQNNLKETNLFKLNITNKKDIAGLPDGIVEQAANKAKEQKKTGWIIDLSAPSYVSFMKYADNRELRKKLYYAYNSKGLKNNEYNNTGLIKTIVKLKIEKAKMLGFSNYADYALQERMAINKENVFIFLNNLKDSYLPIAKKEIAELEQFAKSIGLKDKIQAWDITYYAEKLKIKKFNISEEELRPYFKMENVINGVFCLAEKLYKIKFKETKEIDVYNKDVKIYEVFDENGKFLSLFYADFYPRENKQSGAWMNDFFAQKIKNGQDVRPHIIIVCNFTPSTDKKPSLLTFDEVKTFLHEFGHALHGMLTRCTYSSLSGTNVYRDFVELPSQIMENFAMEKQFLDLFAVNYKTGANISQELIDKIKDSDNFMAGYYCVRQLRYAILDMTLYSLSKFDENIDVIKFENRTLKDLDVIKVPEELGFSPSFKHIFSGGYSAGYYSYKWAEVLDADAFSVFKEKGIFNQEVAKSFRINILEKGGTEHPAKLYKYFREHDATIDALLKRDGIKK